MPGRLTLLKALHADLKASRGPDRVLDARIFQLFDPEAQVLPWPKWIESQVAGRDDFKGIKHSPVRSMPRSPPLKILMLQ